MDVDKSKKKKRVGKIRNVRGCGRMMKTLLMIQFK